MLLLFGKHLVVEGFVIAPDGKPQLYRTSPVVDVIDQTLLYSTSRSYYRLSGPLNVEATVQSGIPLWFAKKFASGFPSNWRDMIDVYLNYVNANDPAKERTKSTDASAMVSLLSCEGFTSLNHTRNSWSSQTKLFSNSDDDAHDVSNDRDDFAAVANDVDLQQNTDGLDVVLNQKKKSQKKDRSAAEETPTPGNIVDSRKPGKSEKSVNEVKAILETPQQRLKHQNVKGNKNDERKKRITRKKRRSYSKKSDDSVFDQSSSFSSPSFSNNGLYRTRSGRHVFPLLESWTYQRLNTEYDANGNEVVVFYPGTDSVLPKSSPACEFLRKANWVHRQFVEDQLMLTPSVGSPKVWQVRKKQRSCVRNILEQSCVDEAKQSNATSPQDVLSRSMSISSGIPQDDNEKSPAQKQIFDSNSSNLIPVKKQSRVKQPEKSSVHSLRNSETSSPNKRHSTSSQEVNPTIDVSSESIKKPAKRFLRSSKPLSASSKLGSSDNASKVDSVPTDCEQTLTSECDKDLKFSCTGRDHFGKYFSVKNSQSERIRPSPLLPPTVAKVATIKSSYNLRRKVPIRSKAKEFFDDLQKGRVSKRHRKPGTEDERSCLKKEPERDAVQTASKCEKMTKRSRLKRSMATNVPEEKTKPRSNKTSRTVESNKKIVENVEGLRRTCFIWSPNKVVTRASLKRGNPLHPVESSNNKLISSTQRNGNNSTNAKVGKIIQETGNQHKNKTTRRRLPRRRKDKAPPTEEVQEYRENDGPPREGEPTPLEQEPRIITARHRTMKQRKQRKEALRVLNENDSEQDFFAGAPDCIANFNSDCFHVGSSAATATPYTPVSKLPENFENYVPTPAWFKTPTNADGFTLVSEETPYFKETPSLFKADKVADQCIVQMQKKSRTRRRPVKSPQKRVTPKKKKTIIPQDLFNVEIDQSHHSSDDDEYFST